MKRILLVNGPNLNMLGCRQPDIYGKTTLAEIETAVSAKAKLLGLSVKSFQSNHEGNIIDFIQAEAKDACGMIINPGALAHYSYALRDCLMDAGIPVIEVHISNLAKREEWRNKSVLTDVCEGMILGLGKDGYLMALDYFQNV